MDAFADLGLGGVGFREMAGFSRLIEIIFDVVSGDTDGAAKNIQPQQQKNSQGAKKFRFHSNGASCHKRAAFQANIFCQITQSCYSLSMSQNAKAKVAALKLDDKQSERDHRELRIDK